MQGNSETAPAPDGVEAVSGNENVAQIGPFVDAQMRCTAWALGRVFAAMERPRVPAICRGCALYTDIDCKRGYDPEECRAYEMAEEMEERKAQELAEEIRRELEERDD